MTSDQVAATFIRCNAAIIHYIPLILNPNWVQATYWRQYVSIISVSNNLTIVVQKCTLAIAACCAAFFQAKKTAIQIILRIKKVINNGSSKYCSRWSLRRWKVSFHFMDNPTRQSCSFDKGMEHEMGRSRYHVPLVHSHLIEEVANLRCTSTYRLIEARGVCTLKWMTPSVNWRRPMTLLEVSSSCVGSRIQRLNCVP